jgi:hypothetical protein
MRRKQSTGISRSISNSRRLEIPLLNIIDGLQRREIRHWTSCPAVALRLRREDLTSNVVVQVAIGIYSHAARHDDTLITSRHYGADVYVYTNELLENSLLGCAHLHRVKVRCREDGDVKADFASFDGNCAKTGNYQLTPTGDVGSWFHVPNATPRGQPRWTLKLRDSMTLDDAQSDRQWIVMNPADWHEAGGILMEE